VTQRERSVCPGRDDGVGQTVDLRRCKGAASKRAPCPSPHSPLMANRKRTCIHPGPRLCSSFDSAIVDLDGAVFASVG
jgi:hypothetical protein